MQRNLHASLAFKSKKTALKPLFGITVINALSILAPNNKTAQANFLNLPVSVKELQAINNELSAAITATLRGNDALIKTAILQWDAAFTLTANYISSIANGNEAIIRNAGFVPVKLETAPAQKRSVATGFKTAVHGSKSTVVARSKATIARTKVYA